MFTITEKPIFDNSITKWEYHSHRPYASSTLKVNDEIRIPVNIQDAITAPFRSFLHISGTLSAKKADNTNADIALVNNAMAFLFEDMRYEISGIEVDRVKNVGITTTIKNLVSIKEQESKKLKAACWVGPGNTESTSDFVYSVPLSMLFGFFEDYQKVIMNLKQELILLRTSSDINAVYSQNASSYKLEIKDLYWKVPHATPNAQEKIRLYKHIEKNTEIDMPFRSWELHEYPTLPTNARQSWTIKTSSQMEKPRYVILAFQTKRKNDLKKNMSQFDDCDLNDLRLYLNSTYYPYDNLKGDKILMYEMYSSFQDSYYNTSSCPILSPAEWTSLAPLYVIDCSRQEDTLKSGAPVDVRLEFEFNANVPDGTTAFCLIIHDALISYSLLTGMLRRRV